ncbi:cytochrome P450 CYP749A22-like [Bidens hawaiensis]|uniref:cytochrome P450 CYP749A22-like n=1 Tax=Bidens hawaiensis TaxID=980011 RepID=UPI00404ADF42
MVTFLGVLIGLLCSIAFLALFKFFHKFWWVPMRITHVMSSQGIRGPPYSFIYGNAKEISNMIKKSTSSPIDMSHYIFPRIQPHLDSWLHIHGKNILYWQGPQAELVVTEPELLKEIMSVREISMGKQDAIPLLIKIFGGGLVFSQGDKWAKQRKLATHAFNGERLKNIVPAMVESVNLMLKRWQDDGNKEKDVHQEFRQMTSEVISRIVFGSSYEEGKQIFKKQEAVVPLAAKQLSKTRFPGFGMIFKDKVDLETDKLLVDIGDTIMKIIKSRENIKASGNEDKSTNDYLGILLNAYHEVDDNNYKLSIQDVIDECRTFYVAGHGTISLLLSWTTLVLGVHTEWQEKAREEVQEVFGNRNPSSEGIARLKKMSMIINETLRLYPPSISANRKVLKETRVGDLVLPANLNLQIPTLALHQDPGIWGEDAHLFKPERFSEGIANVVNNNPGAFLPFGYGPRICVGSNFAINEAKITLSMILQRYRFTVSPNYVHAPVQLITLRPKYGVQIMFHPL